MQVILLEDLSGKGRAGDVVKVADGHARNYLFPRGIAIPANKVNMKTLDSRRTRIEAKRELDIQVAKDRAETLEGLSVRIDSKAGDNGKLFGSVTSQDIADALLATHGIEVEKRKIHLSSPIKETGVHTVQVKIYADVNANVTVLVNTDGTVKETPVDEIPVYKDTYADDFESDEEAFAFAESKAKEDANATADEAEADENVAEDANVDAEAAEEVNAPAAEEAAEAEAEANEEAADTEEVKEEA